MVLQFNVTVQLRQVFGELLQWIILRLMLFLPLQIGSGTTKLLEPMRIDEPRESVGEGKWQGGAREWEEGREGLAWRAVKCKGVVTSFHSDAALMCLSHSPSECCFSSNAIFS